MTGCHGTTYWRARYSEAENKYHQGDSDSAITLAKAGYEALRQRDAAWAWKYRVLQAQALLIRKHKPAESIALLSNEPANLNRGIAAETTIIRAHALCLLGDTAKASELWNEADQQLNEAPRLLRAKINYARGDCLVSTDPGRALKHFQQAAALAQGVDGFEQAGALLNVGYLMTQDGRYDQAIERFNQALGVTDSPWLKEIALGNIGNCNEKLGDWKAASEYLHRAEKLAASVKDGAADRVLWLIDLGQVYFSQLQYPDAEKAWSESLAIARDLKDVPLEGTSLNNLAVFALLTGDRQRAEGYISQGKLLKLPEYQRELLLLTEARVAKANNSLKNAEDLMQQILASHPDTEVRYNTETELATLYSEENRTGDAERMFRQGISTAEKAFARVTSDRFRISFMDQEPFYDRYVKFLVDQNRILDALSITERARSRALAAALELDPVKQLRVSAIQSGLRRTNRIVLAYWLSPKESYLWVITPSQMRFMKLAPEMEIVQAIDAYSQEVLSITRPDDAGLGQKLYAMLIAPAEKYIPKGSQIVIVPHRRLYKLNFETLVSPHPKPHFWIEDVCIQNTSFLAVLEHPTKARPRYARDLLLMGAPVQASKDFPGLEHAPEEIEKVAAHFSSAKETVIDGPAATPAAYTSSDPREYRFFHFVTHGTASDTNPLDSAIILSPSNDGYKLYARDIIKTKINPELVTISTCYGAGTRQYSGEGLVGLAWAFMRVGAHQVVAALWEVDDAANAELMDQFYSELTRGKTAAAALRDGKLAMLHSRTVRNRPYYWASLQLYTGP